MSETTYPMFTFKHLIKTFRNGEQLHYPDEATIPANTITLLTGPSGSGKSTLLNLLSLLDLPDLATFDRASAA